MPFNFGCVGRAYRAVPEVLDRERHGRYAVAVGAAADPSQEFGHPLACFAGVYLLSPLVTQLFADPEVGLDVEHLLHAEQEFAFGRPLEFEETVAPDGLISSAERRRGMIFLEFRCDGRDRDGSVVVRSRSLFVVRQAA
ncbi:MAG: MaoC family dehydratase N-terminal domain-containing protein [Candidatus Dormibacteria bacterium]